MKPLIVVATDVEEELAKKRFKGHKIIKTGVGCINVIQTLRKIPKWREIINFGYVGSNNIPIGTEISIGFCESYHPSVDFLEPAFIINDVNSRIWCYTSSDFVLHTDIKEPCVFDMELAYICALGFKNIKSIKIVSDNLSLKQYEDNV